MQQRIEQTVDQVHERDVWLRNSDGTVVYVHTLSDFDERLVGWQTLNAPLRTGICTEDQFVRRYRLRIREGEVMSPKPADVEPFEPTERARVLGYHAEARRPRSSCESTCDSPTPIMRLAYPDHANGERCRLTESPALAK